MRRFDNRHRPAPVLFTRGEGTSDLAELLSTVPPVRVKGDLSAACIQARSDLLVTRRLSSTFDMASQVVPHEFDPNGIEHVVAAVSGGPHSPLAARVARRLGESLGTKHLMVCAYHDDATHAEALALIERLYAEVPGLEYRTVEASDADGLITQLPEQSCLVIGAPGGSWLQRTFFGQGARLRQKAPAGVVVVQSAPERVFLAMGDPVFVGSLRDVEDVLRIHDEKILAVADRARLVGLVDRETLLAVDGSTVVGDIMEDPVGVTLDATLDEAHALAERFGTEAIPVVDDDGYLVGGLVAGEL